MLTKLLASNGVTMLDDESWGRIKLGSAARYSLTRLLIKRLALGSRGLDAYIRKRSSMARRGQNI